MSINYIIAFNLLNEVRNAKMKFTHIASKYKFLFLFNYFPFVVSQLRAVSEAFGCVLMTLNLAWDFKLVFKNSNIEMIHTIF